MTEKKIKRFSFTVDNHLNRYGVPTQPQSVRWSVQYDDGTIEEGPST